MASSAMDMAINMVGDQYGLPKGWLNQDFKKTASYSPKIAEYSVYYRTFSSVLQVCTLPAEYIAAMKLVSLREYKYDCSDVIGLAVEAQLSKERIEKAVSDLYGGMDKLTRQELAQKLLDEIYSHDDMKELYQKYREYEKENYGILKDLDSKYSGLLNTDNVGAVLKAAREKLHGE
ncbi:MAG: hypothetical protein K6B44_02500 [Lachnospiraceae bacterium]|nr:hypothetical protein [Lachnospiraceae bacterium]